MILREIFAKLGLDVDAESFAKGELAAAAVEKALDKLVDMAKEAVATFVENIKATAEYGETIVDLAQQAGISTDKLQRLSKATAEEGIAVEDFAHSMVLFSRTINGATKGGDGQEKVFHRLGIRLKDTHGKIRATDEVLGDVAESFAKLPDGAEKTALSLQLFGRSGARMIPVLNKGREELERFHNAQVMTPEQLAAGKEVVVIQRQLAMQTKALWREAIGPLLPAIANLLKRFLAWKKANAEVIKGKIREYVGYAISAIQGLSNAFSFLVRNAAAVKVGLEALLVTFALLNTAAVGAAVKIAAAWLLAAAPFILIGGIIAGLLLIYDDLRVYAKDPTGTHSLYGRFKKQIDEWLKPNEKDPWFLAAIKSFVRYIKEAIDAIIEFNNLTKPATTEEGKQGQTARKRAAAFDVLSGSGILQGGDVAGRFAAANPTGATTAQVYREAYEQIAGILQGAGAGAVLTIPKSYLDQIGPSTFNVVQNITAAPGDKPEDVASKARDQFDEWHSSKLEEAKAAAQ